MIAARKVGAADRPLEQHVAHDRQLAGRMVEDDMAGRMAGAMIDVQGELADRHLIAVMQPAIGLEALPRHVPALAILRQPVDPEPVILVRPLDRHAQVVGQHARLAAMVDMAMGDEQLFDRDAMLLRRLLEHRQVAAGIDEGAAHRVRAPEQRAILL